MAALWASPPRTPQEEPSLKEDPTEAPTYLPVRVNDALQGRHTEM
jgi:hypothetical protein